jgi:CO/xanthine dehydrogenase Mo-binding subunit
VDFAVESLMDELAEELHLDPYMLRQLNALEAGDQTATGQILKEPVTLKHCMEQAIAKISWAKLRSVQPQGPLRRGIGMAASFRGISVGGRRIDSATAVVTAQEDGQVLVSTGFVEGGQGPWTVLRQVCAEVLGISLDQVRFQDWDTSSVPDCGPTSASRSTLVGGNAVKAASEELLGRIVGIAAELLKVDETRLVCRQGLIYDRRKPQKKLSFVEVVRECVERGESLIAVGSYKAPRTTGTDPETGQGIPFFDYVYGADVAEVEVDTRTGQVRLLHFVSAHDVGRAINPALVAGQVFGGICMGLGTTLLEEYRTEQGKPLVLNFDQYLIPTAADMGKVEVVIVESNNPEGPFGASSIAEPAIQIVAPAIANAIAHATGRRVRHLPADLEKVYLGHEIERKSIRESERTRSEQKL